jgi:hypothetical protein
MSAVLISTADRQAAFAASVAQNWRAIVYTDDEEWLTDELVQIAVEQSGLALEFCTVAQQGDRALVLKAVASAGEALK